MTTYTRTRTLYTRPSGPVVNTSEDHGSVDSTKLSVSLHASISHRAVCQTKVRTYHVLTKKGRQRDESFSSDFDAAKVLQESLFWPVFLA